MHSFPKLEQLCLCLFRLIRLSLASGLLASSGVHLFFPPAAHAAEVGQGIFEDQLVNGNLSNALKVLRTEVRKTRLKLSPSLTNEFETTLLARLREIQSDASSHIVQEYKSAIIAKRLLELSEHVFTLPYRSIPPSPQERTKAQEQYAAALNRLEKGIKARSGNQRPGGIAMIRHALSEVQTDLFRPGYGKPLRDRERVELNRIIDRILKDAAALTKIEERKRFAASAKMSSDAMRAMMKFLGDRDALRNNQSFRKAFESWRGEIAATEQPVDLELRRTTQVEYAAVLERARKQEEKDRWENDPENIERERKLKELREKGPEGPAPKIL